MSHWFLISGNPLLLVDSEDTKLLKDIDDILEDRQDLRVWVSRVQGKETPELQLRRYAHVFGVDRVKESGPVLMTLRNLCLFVIPA